MNKQEEEYRRLATAALEKAQPFRAMEDGKAVIGAWHKIMMPDCQCANGEDYCCYLKKGNGPNLIIFMIGGGLLWDTPSAGLPGTIHTAFTGAPCLYTSEAVPMNDCWFFGAEPNNGILSMREDNPFRDWSIGMVNYGTGDFHLGDNEVNGVQCRGLHNLHACLDVFQQYLPQPEKLLICGESAGGFSVPGVAEEILKHFPCMDVTLLTDSALLERTDWQTVVRDVWHGPEYLWWGIHSRDIVADWYERFLTAHPGVRCLYDCGIHDVALAQFQCYMDGGPFEVIRPYLTALPQKLKAQHDRLAKLTANFGFYYHDFPDAAIPSGSQHMTLAHPTFTGGCVEGVSPAKWVWDAVNGNVKSYGLSSLGVCDDELHSV